MSDAVDALIANNVRLFSLVKAIRNGLVCGVKLRFPHAFVTSFITSRGKSPQESFVDVVEITTEHARRLGKFVFLFKSMLYCMEWASGNKEHPIHPFIAGVIGGAIVFGERTRMTEQINYYLLSRILVGLAKVILDKCKSNKVVEEDGLINTMINRFGWRVFASVVWGFVMWLFYYHDKHLQGGLRSSMTYLYKDSEKFTDFKSLIIANKPRVEDLGKWWTNVLVGTVAIGMVMDWYIHLPVRK
eukprot:NODE_237_length_1120_cov_403.775428_g231_i0.p1 GENE.NODE_237_length_1120_cov_403.775428_g231_i0~~NODE_237_length_1120_cov_403.775428_g231_i0.p1  ORF type:complete len:244 (+),score=39.01 NODE_237_length_1120_cov_403.775428_g231_i0:227-958(+)